jgi:hypothetical protein
MRNYYAEKIANRNYEVPAIGAPPPLPEAPPEQIDLANVGDYHSVQPSYDNRAAVQGWCTIVSLVVLITGFTLRQISLNDRHHVSSGAEETTTYGYGSEQDWSSG